MAGRTVLREDDLSACHHRFILGDEIFSAWRVLEPIGLQTGKELSDVLKLLLSSQPVHGIFLRRRDFEWFLLGQPDQHVVLLQKVLRVAPNVDVNAQGRTDDTDGVGAIFQNVRYRHRDGVSAFLDCISYERQKQRLAGQRFFCSLGRAHTEQEDRVDRIGIIDVIRCDSRSI